MIRSLIRRQPHHLAALMVSSLLMTAGSAVQAQAEARIDRSTLDAAQGEFVLEDGRALNLRLRSRSVEIRIDEQDSERWKPESAEVLVSPDGRQRLHLHRDRKGFVDRVSLETQRAR